MWVYYNHKPVEELQKEELPPKNTETELYNPFLPLPPPREPSPKQKMAEETSNGSIKIRVPDAFNGDKKKVQTFLQSVKQYIQIEKKKFKSDANKIIWAMSYMPKGEAAQFGDNIYNKFFNKNKDLKFEDWEKKLLRSSSGYLQGTSLTSLLALLGSDQQWRQ